MVCLCCLPGLHYAQQGRVIDAETGVGIPQAHIQQGENLYVCDSEGNFTYEAGAELLEISHAAYEGARFKALPAVEVVRFPLQPSSYDLDEVIITAGTYQDRLLDQSHAISVLDRKAISAQPDLSPSTVLNTVPGVYMHQGTWSTNRITIRGMGARTPFGSNRIRAFWNNIPLTAGDGSSSLEDIDLSIVDQITVIKGPNSSLYGAGLGGTILLRSRPDSRSYAYGQSGMGSFGRQRQQIGINWQSARQRRIQLHANRLHSDGWRQNNRYDRSNLLLLTDRIEGKKESHGILGYTYVNGEIPSSLDSLTFVNTPEAAAANWLATGGYENYHKLMGGISKQQKLFGHYQWVNSLYGRWQRGEELRPFNYQEERTAIAGTRQSALWKDEVHSLKKELSLGLEAFYEWYREGLYQNDNNQKGDLIRSQKQDRLLFNLFAQGIVERDRWQGEAGLNLHQTRYIQVIAGEPRDLYQTRVILSPRLALRYKPVERSTLFAQVSHGASPLSPDDLSTTTGRLNTDIQPETGLNIEFGFRRKAKQYYIDLIAYHQIITNLLVTERTIDDTFVGKNAGKTDHQGLELSIDWQLFANSTAWDGSKLSLRGAYNHYRFREFIDNGIDYSRNPVTGVPQWQGSSSFNLQHETGVFVNLIGQGVGSMSVVDSNTIRTRSYMLLSAKAGYKGELASHWIYTLSIAGQNLNDTRYASMVLINAPSFGAPPRYYYPGAPVNLWAEARLQYFFD